MKSAIFCLLVLAAMVTVEAGDFSTTYGTAKNSFDQLASGVDFDGAVNALIPYIHSDMSVFACTVACQGAAAYVLGPAAVLSGVLCPPLCDG
ncbi:conotoxin [Plakobranchus ocellatus]|uniref:Conotoxin n=1 Tax=Plakobranchus ocellatus TaxID=259542 RepID=A0AAV3YSQ8_9GAST|nr:conotoxin [Plakobranchus ocellatus]